MRIPSSSFFKLRAETPDPDTIDNPYLRSVALRERDEIISNYTQMVLVGLIVLLISKVIKAFR